MSFIKSGDRLLHSAVREGLACLLYKNLLQSEGLAYLSPKQQHTLEALYYQTVIFNLRLLDDLKEILTALKEKGTEITLLQGITLLNEIYADIGLRPMTDIDIWVLERDYGELIKVLLNNKYHRDPLYPNVFKRGDTIFDLHTHILWADRIRTRSMLLKMEQGRIYDCTVIREIEGLRARCLNPYDQILYLSLHALKHNAEKLIWALCCGCFYPIEMMMVLGLTLGNGISL